MTEIIRKGTEADFFAVLELIKEFEQESFAEYGLKCENAITLSIMPRFLDSGLILEVDGKIQGVIAGVVNECPTSGEPIFQEALWFVRKEYRSLSERLFEAMESYCKNVLGVSKIVMCEFGDSRLSAKDRLFRKHGYRIMETHYIKAV